MTRIRSLTINPLLRRVMVFIGIFVVITGVSGPRIISGHIMFRDGFALYGGIGKALIFSAVAFILLVRHNKQELRMGAWSRVQLWWAGASVLLFAVAWVAVTALLHDNRTATTLGLAHAGLLGSLVAAAVACFGIATIRELWRVYRRELLISVGLGALFYVFLTLVYALWRPLAAIVLVSVHWLLGLLGLSGTILPPNTLLFDKFGITVAEYCSGIESIALFTALYAVVGMLDWPKIRRDRFFALFPLALLGLSLCNILRVSLLILAGYRVNPEIAFSLFHSYAGMIFFILYSTVFWSLFYKYLIREPVSPEIPDR
jgi:exosortase/archaeosortase family protein